MTQFVVNFELIIGGKGNVMDTNIMIPVQIETELLLLLFF